MRAFADALDCVPMALAENSGLSPIETLANIKSRQAKENNSRLGVDCMQTGSNGKSQLLIFLCGSILSLVISVCNPSRHFTNICVTPVWSLHVPPFINHLSIAVSWIDRRAAISLTVHGSGLLLNTPFQSFLSSLVRSHRRTARVWSAYNP